MICGEFHLSLTEVENLDPARFRALAQIALSARLAGRDKESADWVWGEFMRGENNADRFKLKEIGNKTKNL